jgi:hypothetical protein
MNKPPAPRGLTSWLNDHKHNIEIICSITRQVIKIAKSHTWAEPCPLLLKGNQRKSTDITIHWKALGEHFLMVPFVFRFNHFSEGGSIWWIFLKKLSQFCVEYEKLFI